MNNCRASLSEYGGRGTQQEKKFKKHKIVSLSLNIITRDTVWVVTNGEELAQNKKPFHLGA